MPTMRRTRDPARHSATPASRRPVTPSRPSRAWFAMIMLVVLIVFAVALAQTSFVMALVAALAALVAGVMLLTLMFGTTWVIRPRRRESKLPQGR